MLPLIHDRSVNVDVLGTDDLIYGTLIALVLAFTASFLQGRANQSDTVTVISKVDPTNVTVANQAYASENQRNVFDGDSWQEMSRPDNYILYNRKVRGRGAVGRPLKASSKMEVERVWIIVALLALFVPIFFIEIFFALSRQMICGGDTMNQSDWASYLCSPVR